MMIRTIANENIRIPEKKKKHLYRGAVFQLIKIDVFFFWNEKAKKQQNDNPITNINIPPAEK